LGNLSCLHDIFNAIVPIHGVVFYNSVKKLLLRSHMRRFAFFTARQHFIVAVSVYMDSRMVVFNLSTGKGLLQLSIWKCRNIIKRVEKRRWTSKLESQKLCLSDLMK